MACECHYRVEMAALCRGRPGRVGAYAPALRARAIARHAACRQTNRCCGGCARLAAAGGRGAGGGEGQLAAPRNVGTQGMSTQATRPSSQRVEVAGVLGASGTTLEQEPLTSAGRRPWAMGGVSTEARTRYGADAR